MKTERDEFGNYDFDDEGPCPECGAVMLTYVAQFDDVICTTDDCPFVGWLSPWEIKPGQPSWEFVDGRYRRKQPSS